VARAKAHRDVAGELHRVRFPSNERIGPCADAGGAGRRLPAAAAEYGPIRPARQRRRRPTHHLHILDRRPTWTPATVTSPCVRLRERSLVTARRAIRRWRPKATWCRVAATETAADIEHRIVLCELERLRYQPHHRDARLID
jgi:hypothetical protein